MSAFNSVRLGVGTTFASVACIFIFLLRCEHGKTNDFFFREIDTGHASAHHHWVGLLLHFMLGRGFGLGRWRIRVVFCIAYGL
jgi:hypothetical protein